MFAAVLLLNNGCERKTDPPGGDSLPAASYNPDSLMQVYNLKAWDQFSKLCANSEPGRTVFVDFVGNYDLFLLPEGAVPPRWDTRVADMGKQRKGRWATLAAEGRWRTADGKPSPGPQVSDPGRVLVLDEFIQAGLKSRPHHPIIDRNGNYVHTAVFYNDVLYNFVLQNNLYNKPGLDNLLQNPSSPALVRFEGKGLQPAPPKGDSVENYRITAPDGSLMIKSSWKVLGEGDDSTQFITSRALLIFQNNNTTGEVYTSFKWVTVGLVGLHLAYKDAQNPNWVWNTFEQAGNVPADSADSGTYSFFSPRKPPYDTIAISPATNIVTTCSVQDPPTACCDVATVQSWYDPFRRGQQANNVWRQTPIGKITAGVNQQMNARYKGSVLEHYILVGSQWATGDDITGGVETLHSYPQVLANSTLESFEQRNASCMGCHNLVTGKLNDAEQMKVTDFPFSISLISRTDTVNGKPRLRTLYTDFSWSLQKYQKQGHLSWTQIVPETDECVKCSSCE